MKQGSPSFAVACSATALAGLALGYFLASKKHNVLDDKPKAVAFGENRKHILHPNAHVCSCITKLSLFVYI